MERPIWAPPEVDLDRPSPARIYDYMLGGSHNFACDRELANQLLSVAPEIGPTAHANRALLRRITRFLAHSGIRQFVDIGSGIPTVGNVHEIVQSIVPDARVVYVDTDPIAVAHSTAILNGVPHTAVLRADLRQPWGILESPTVQRMIDFSQPVALLLVAVLHFIPDEEGPQQAVATLREALAPGSFLAVSQNAPPDKEITAEGHQVLTRYVRTASPIGLRNREQVTAFFGDWELVEPGVVPYARWRPDPDEEMDDDRRLMPSFAGVARKP